MKLQKHFAITSSSEDIKTQGNNRHTEGNARILLLDEVMNVSSYTEHNKQHTF